MNETPQNNTDQNNNGNPANCPICGYFIGILSTCPRCGTRANKCMSIKAVRKIAIFGSIIGILLLWYAAYLKQPEIMKISDITEVMNNALVVIEGRVTRIQFDEDRNTFKMTVNDGTGDIKMNAFNKLRKFRKELGDNMPSYKDKVRVAGSLNISQAWGSTMFLSIPSRIKIVEKYTIEDRTVDKITKEDEGKLLWIEVETVDYEEFITRKNFAIHKFLLADDTGDIQMVLYDNEFKSLPDDIRSAMTRNWNKFRIQVEVSVYREKPQVKIVDVKNIKIISLLSDAVSEKIKAGRKKEVKNINKNDIGNVYFIDSIVDKADFGEKGVFLNLEGPGPNLFIRYTNWEKMAGSLILNDGSGKITAPMLIETKNNKLRLRIADFTKTKITELPSAKKTQMTIREILAKKSKEKASQPAEPAPAAVEKAEPVDLSEVKKIDIKKIKGKDIGKIYFITAQVDSIDFGTDGVYLDLAETDIDLFILYDDQEKIEDFHLLNTGDAKINAAAKVIHSDNKIGLKLADLGSFKIEKEE
ncbi:hypothetical protein ACFLUV_00705 [Elusimicrobiota bacterium]